MPSLGLSGTRREAGQELLYADSRYAILIIFQAMDAARKDGTIKHVMSGINPQGCKLFGFTPPSAEELSHNFLWRYSKALPEPSKERRAALKDALSRLEDE